MAIDLKNWKLTLPVDSNNEFKKTAEEINPLPQDYSKVPYFIRNSNGSITFAVPAEGATTSGSHYPRCELREMINGKEAAWHSKDSSVMIITTQVDELPVTNKGKPGRVVIGQIHGPKDELCRLYYDNGVVYFYDDKAGSKKKETQFILRDGGGKGKATNIPLGEHFSYKILVKNNILEVNVFYNGAIYQASEPISSFWDSKKALYFKVGAYLQVGKPGSGAGTVGTGWGKVTVYSIEVHHA